MTEDVDINNTIRRLSSRLRVEMNGAVSASMRESGVEYRLNYGVSIPSIKDIAAEYYGHHELALRLYESQVRELRLAAIFIENPADISPAQMQDWKTGITSRELAEHMAMNLLCHAYFGFELAVEWILDENKYVSYSAMMTLSRILRKRHGQGQNIKPSELEALLPIIDIAIDKAQAAGMLWHGALTLLSSCAQADESMRTIIKEHIAQLRDSSVQQLKNLSSELSWQI